MRKNSDKKPDNNKLSLLIKYVNNFQTKSNSSKMEVGGSSSSLDIKNNNNEKLRTPSIMDEMSAEEELKMNKKMDKKISRIDIVFSQEKLKNKQKKSDKKEGISNSYNFVKLNTQGLLLKFPKSQLNLYDNFLKVLSSKYSKEIKMIFFAFFLVYLVKTLIIISMRKYYDYNLLVLLFRGVFNLLIIFSIYFIDLSVQKENLRYFIKHIVSFCYVFGILTAFFEINFSLIGDSYIISFLEVMIICLAYSNV